MLSDIKGGGGGGVPKVETKRASYHRISLQLEQPTSDKRSMRCRSRFTQLKDTLPLQFTYRKLSG